MAASPSHLLTFFRLKQTLLMLCSAADTLGGRVIYYSVELFERKNKISVFTMYDTGMPQLRTDTRTPGPPGERWWRFGNGHDESLAWLSLDL
jgi:hypothetical protein